MGSTLIQVGGRLVSNWFVIIVGLSRVQGYGHNSWFSSFQSLESVKQNRNGTNLDQKVGQITKHKDEAEDLRCKTGDRPDLNRCNFAGDGSDYASKRVKEKSKAVGYEKEGSHRPCDQKNMDRPLVRLSHFDKPACVGKFVTDIGSLLGD